MGLPRPDRRSVIVTVGCVLIFLACILVISGLCTNHWYDIWDGNVYNNRIVIHFGLHRVCFRSSKCTNPGSNYDQKDYLPKVQAMIIVGGFMALFSTIFALINTVTDRLGWSHLAVILPAAACAFISGVFLMIGLILYAAKVEINHEYITQRQDIRLGWSFGLTAVADSFLFIGGILMSASTMSKPTPKFE